MTQGLKGTNGSSAIMGAQITISEIGKLTTQEIDLLPTEKVREAAIELLKLRAKQIEHALPLIPREYTESLLAKCIDYSQQIEASKMQPGLDVTQIIENFIEIGIRARRQSIDKLDPEQTNKLLTDYLNTTTNMQQKAIAETDPQQLKIILKGFAHQFGSAKGIDELEHDAVMKMPVNELRALLIARTGKSAFFYRQFVGEEYHAPAMIAKYGNAETALKKVMGYLWTLESLIEKENFPDVPVDWDPIMHTTIALLRRKWVQSVQLEARFEASLQAQVTKIASEMYNIRPDLVKHAKKIVEYKKQVDDLSKILQVLGEKHVTETKDKNERIKQLDEAKKHLEKEIFDYKAKEIQAKTAFDKQLDDLTNESNLIKVKLADSIPKTQYDDLHTDFETATTEIKKQETELNLANKENFKLADKVMSLETDVEKERTDKEIYQNQNIKGRRAYDDKEMELTQEREIVKAERGKVDAARTKADKLEKKLNNINKKWGIKVGIGAALLAAGLYFYRPSSQIAPVENVPQEVINYSKDRFTIKFGNKQYEMSADRFNEIYSEIQHDQKKAGKQFTPADRKQYFEKKTESTIQIK